ncbi:MAG: hypothetical protein K8R57_02935 [Verrucomicrobia bacterium]|nr:hypothetical protein [Verrucomicrobiota bacterium]
MKTTQSDHPLYRLRFALGQMTETAFADLIGIPRHQVANIEHGRSKGGFDLQLSRRIQAATGVSSESLMRGDKPLIMMNGKKLDPAGFEAWIKQSVSEEDRISQKEEVALRCQLLLDAAAARGNGDLRRMFHRLCGAIEEVREEAKVTFSDIDSQARKGAEINDGIVTRSQLDELIGDSPDYQHLRNQLPAKGPIKTMVESFRNWGALAERVAIKFGHTTDSTESIRSIWRIQAKDGIWHEITMEKFYFKGLGNSNEADRVLKEIKGGAKSVRLDVGLD